VAHHWVGQEEEEGHEESASFQHSQSILVGSQLISPLLSSLWKIPHLWHGYFIALQQVLNSSVAGAEQG